MDTVEILDEGPVRYVWLNRPTKLNGMTPEMKQYLVAAFDEASRDRNVRCVVLSGRGRAFSAGGDIRTMEAELSPGDAIAQASANAQVAPALARLAKPVIAAVNGLAVGSGFSLALACDILVARQDAWFSQQFRHRGLVPDSGSTFLLARQVGLYRAKEMVFTGRRVTASEAYDLGIVSHVWPAADFVENVKSYALSLAEGPTVAIGLAKRLLSDAFETSLASAIEREAIAQYAASMSRDHAASLAAFRDKTGMKFEGR
jgi:2-(1,2-epoxy-1,2-dihydrophenyl)acetyl-CoA isomerase